MLPLGFVCAYNHTFLGLWDRMPCAGAVSGRLSASSENQTLTEEYDEPILSIGQWILSGVLGVKRIHNVQVEVTLKPQDIVVPAMQHLAHQMQHPLMSLSLLPYHLYVSSTLKRTVM